MVHAGNQHNATPPIAVPKSKREGSGKSAGPQTKRDNVVLRGSSLYGGRPMEHLLVCRIVAAGVLAVCHLATRRTRVAHKVPGPMMELLLLPPTEIHSSN